MPKYKYSRQSPNPARREFDHTYLPGHMIGLKKRRDMLNPKAKIEKQVYCSCKWKDDTWVTTKRMITIRFNNHILSCMNQGELFDV